MTSRGDVTPAVGANQRRPAGLSDVTRGADGRRRLSADTTGAGVPGPTVAVFLFLDRWGGGFRE